MKVKATLNPQVSNLLHTMKEKMIELKHPPLDVLTPEQSREFYRVAREFFTTMSIHGIGIENEFIPSIKGHEIPIRIYKPSGQGPFPVLVYSHGGGWVFGDLESSDNICRYFSKHAGIIVVSVGYRLAPEHKYPSAFQDVIETVKWTFRNMARLEGDVTRVGVGGESSGGNLAAAAAIYFRNVEEYNLAFQFLITPVLDYHFDTLSYRENYNYNLTNEKMKWFWGHYLNNPYEGQEVFVSPLKVPSVNHLPSTLLVTAEFDPLREEGFAYGKRLKEASIEVEQLHFEDMVHSFINMIGTVDKAKQALEEMTIKLRDLLKTVGINR